MTTVTITDEGGQITVAVDGGQPQPVESAAAACELAEQAFGATEAGEGEMPPEGISSAGMEQSAMDQGFAGVRGGMMGR